MATSQFTATSFRSFKSDSGYDKLYTGLYDVVTQAFDKYRHSYRGLVFFNKTAIAAAMVNKAVDQVEIRINPINDVRYNTSAEWWFWRTNIGAMPSDASNFLGGLDADTVGTQMLQRMTRATLTKAGGAQTAVIATGATAQALVDALAAGYALGLLQWVEDGITVTTGANGGIQHGGTTTAPVIIITYHDAYTDCTPPSSVGISKNNVAPGETVQVTFSGAKAGTNNPIAGYKIYRAASPNGEYSLLGTVDTSATSGFFAVTAPENNGGTYYYKVKTIASVAGYDSGLSSDYAALTCSFSAPAITSVTVDGGTEAYKKAGENANLAWAASPGTNNQITKYQIYRDGVLYAETTSTSRSVPANGTDGGDYTYTVYAIGTHSNSAESAGRTVYTYSDPSAPTAISVSETLVNAGSNAVLSWSGAGDGAFNAKRGYHIYRATAEGGPYSLLAEVLTTESGGSRQVTAHSTDGQSYYYKIYTLGARSNSAISASYAALKTNAAPAPPAAFTATPLLHETGDVVLSWSVPSDPDGNYDHQEIQRAIKPKAGSYGAWEALTTEAGSSFADTPTLNEGDRARYQTRSVDSLGKTSAWVLSGEVIQNSAPTAPTFLSASPAAYESGPVTLAWGGQTDPDGNYDHQEIEYDFKPLAGSYGAWAPLKTSTGNSTTTTPALERGDRIKYHTRSVDALGKPSTGWVESNEVIRNLLPDEFTVSAPASGTTIYNARPWVIAVLGVEPNGQTQQLQGAVDGGAYVNIGAVLGINGGTVQAAMPADISPGAHEISLRIMNGAEVAGTPVTRSVMVEAPDWTRDIVAGVTIIYGSGFNHIPDILQLQSRANAVRAYFGLAGIVLPGTVGNFSDWLSQMQALQSALEECYTLSGRTPPAWIDPPGNGPRADIINQLRQAIADA